MELLNSLEFYGSLIVDSIYLMDMLEILLGSVERKKGQSLKLMNGFLNLSHC